MRAGKEAGMRGEKELEKEERREEEICLLWGNRGGGDKKREPGGSRQKFGAQHKNPDSGKYTSWRATV